jgi:hypothetical protein
VRVFKTKDSRCGVKATSGDPCVLPSGHDSDTDYRTRMHKTANSVEFAFNLTNPNPPNHPDLIWMYDSPSD